MTLDMTVPESLSAALQQGIPDLNRAALEGIAARAWPGYTEKDITQELTPLSA